MKQFAQRLVSAPSFEYVIVALIIGNGALLGMETSPALVRRFGEWMHLGNQLVLAVFILEALLKMMAVAPQINRYFRDGWNVFDFLVIVFSLLPATGEYAMIARLARLLRVLRLISTIQELRLIVSTLVRSIPSMGHVMLLMSIIFYIYAITGYQLFHEHDPVHWRNLGISLLSLFRIVDVGRLDGHYVYRHGTAPDGLAVFRQFRGARHVRRHQSLYRGGAQQSGRSQGRAPSRTGTARIAGRNLTRPSLDSEGLAPFGRNDWTASVSPDARRASGAYRHWYENS